MFNDEKYDWEKILELFGGYKYFSKDHLLFVYHDVNGRKEEAAKYKELIDEENEKIEAAVKKLKKPEDIRQAEALALASEAIKGYPADDIEKLNEDIQKVDDNKLTIEIEDKEFNI